MASLVPIAARKAWTRRNPPPGPHGFSRCHGGMAANPGLIGAFSCGKMATRSQDFRLAAYGQILPSRYSFWQASRGACSARLFHGILFYGGRSFSAPKSCSSYKPFVPFMNFGSGGIMRVTSTSGCIAAAKCCTASRPRPFSWPCWIGCSENGTGRNRRTIPARRFGFQTI